MNRTKIEWCDYSINPIKGLCRNTCPYCYAKRMYKRFKWDEHIRQDFSALADIVKLKKPSKIFVGSMYDILGNWVPYHWINGIIDGCKEFPQHTFIFLTKNPKRYKEFIFPENCWLGTSIESNKNLGRLYDLTHLTKGRNKIFVSFEPLLDDLEDLPYYLSELAKIDWAIIGGLTPRPVHKNEWAAKLVEYLIQLNIPIFLKDNLKYSAMIKEYPEVKNE